MTLPRALVVFLLAAPASANVRVPELSGSAVVFSAPAADTVVRAGDTIEIRWTGIPEDSREVELLLSLGGRRAALRLTEELDARSRSFLWHVPNLASDDARFEIRMGIAGREVKSAPGPEFRIVPDPSLRSVLLAWKEGELWVDEREPNEEDGERTAEPLVGLAASPVNFRADPGETRSADLPRPDAAPARTNTFRRYADLEPSEATGQSLSSPSRVPRTIPPRI